MTRDTAAVAGLDPLTGYYNPFVAGAMLDPYPAYRALRDRDPVHHNPEIGYWFLSRYADVAALDRDGTRLIRGDAMNVLFEPYRGTALHRLLSWTLFGLDEPDHGRMKGLIVKTFTRRRIEALRPRIERICADLLDGLQLDPHGGTLSLIPGFAYPLPFLVICELLGVAAGDRGPFLGWTRDLLRMADPFPAPEVVERATTAAAAFEGFLLRVLDERRAVLRAGGHMPPGLLSGLVEAAEDGVAGGEPISEQQLSSQVFALLAAGFENVTNLIGNTVRALAENPEQAQALRDDPGLLANLPDEVLRYYSTTQYNMREAATDLTVDGRTVPAGAHVILLRGAANRDERRFADPDTFDLRRPDSAQHIGFGSGATFCTGAALARLEVQIAFAALLQRIGEFRIIRWEQQESKVFWGPAKVEIAYHPVGGPPVPRP